MIGLALVAVGILGMVMLVGLIALRLFTAAIVSLFMLLLAPAAVLAPALGEVGHTVFRVWLTRLLGAVSSKLLYSFLLGAVLMMQRLLTSIESLGWWTQWLLMSTFWWAVFLKRHQAAAFLQSGGRDRVSHGHRSIGRRTDGVRQAHDAASRPVSWAKSKLFGPRFERPGEPSLRSPKSVNRSTDGATVGGRASSRVERGRSDHDHSLAARALAKQAQLTRLRGAREAALAAGDRRRAAKLAIRGQRVQAELDREPSQRHDPGRVEAQGKRIGFTSRPVRSTARADHPQLGDRLGTDLHAGEPTRASSKPTERRSLQDSSPDRQKPSAPLPHVAGAGGWPDARKARSSIMDDAHAVAEKRKRQLGFEQSPVLGSASGEDPTTGHEPQS